MSQNIPGMRVGVWWAIPNPKIELLGDVYFRDHAYQIQTLISLIGTRRSPSHDTKNSPWKLWVFVVDLFLVSHGSAARFEQCWCFEKVKTK
jgi:hypothetical protein